MKRQAWVCSVASLVLAGFAVAAIGYRMSYIETFILGCVSGATAMTVNIWMGWYEL